MYSLNQLATRYIAIGIYRPSNHHRLVTACSYSSACLRLTNTLLSFQFAYKAYYSAWERSRPNCCVSRSMSSMRFFETGFDGAVGSFIFRSCYSISLIFSYRFCSWAVSFSMWSRSAGISSESYLGPPFLYTNFVTTLSSLRNFSFSCLSRAIYLSSFSDFSRSSFYFFSPSFLNSLV